LAKVLVGLVGGGRDRSGGLTSFIILKNIL
jgi:hypothetical protein